MLKIKATATVALGLPFYTKKLKPGMKVSVDAIKPFAICESGYLLRVTSIWKTPKWFDAHWFSELKHKN